MSGGGCLIIDDVTAAVSALAEPARSIVVSSADSVREAVLDFAVRRGWYVVHHKTFATWALQSLRSAGAPSLALDPLFPVPSPSDRIHKLRISRDYDQNETAVCRRYRVTGAGLASTLQGISGDIVIVDDAASSGSTILHVCGCVAACGLEVSEVFVCASSRSARDRVRQVLPAARWHALVTGDWKVIHLRDGCPYLPFSGRRSDQPPVVGANGGTIAVNSPPSELRGNLWSVLSLDSRVRAAVAAARSDVARRLSLELGRTACVRDLEYLGPDVSALKVAGLFVKDIDPL
jgi:hypothetical protein